MTMTTEDRRHPSIAVLIPCYNEELTIGEVVRQFRQQLPNARIYVFDNNSQDHTAQKASEAGAIVYHEPRQGKGFVVQAMFRRISAEIYVMVDGDGTYDPAEVHALIEPVQCGDADMVVGSRLVDASKAEFEALNRFGNRMFLALLNRLFRVQLTDMLSGYRAFGRTFTRTVPLRGGGFETEAELTIKALQRGLRIVEVPARLAKRPEGSFSKIRVTSDGLRILGMMFSLFRDYKPLTFFGALGLIAIALGLVPGTMVVTEFLRTGLVPRLPSAVLAVGLVLSGMLSFTVGLVLHTIARRSQEFDYQARMLIEDLEQRLDRRAERSWL